MTPEEHDAQWVCGYCEATYVVPSLARLCETKHEMDEERGAGDESQC